MLVGLNYPYPWNAYGTYFGAGLPPGSRPELDVWLVHLRENLDELRELGVRVVRIFLFCNALNYGTFEGGRFRPPATLHPRFEAHLVDMLEIFRRTEMRVIPSLLDFKALGRTFGKNGCTNRACLAGEASIRRTFLEQTLEAFLRVSTPYRDSILAWEVINEPTWNLRRFTAPPSSAGGRTLRPSELSTFLSDAVARIDAAGFPSTVGHRFAADLDRFPTGSVRQFHYYPERAFGFTFVDRRLPAFAETGAILGEFGVKAPGAGHGAAWPGLFGRDAGSTEARVVARLTFASELGYPLALLWPDGVDGRGGHGAVPGPDPLQISPGVKRGLAAFARS